MGVIYISMGLFKVSSCQNDFPRPFQVIFKNNAFSITSRPARTRRLPPLSMKSHRLTIKSAIYWPGPISPCLSTPHLLHYSLQSHLNRQMTRWDVQSGRGGETGRRGRRQQIETERLNTVITAGLK